MLCVASCDVHLTHPVLGLTCLSWYAACYSQTRRREQGCRAATASFFEDTYFTSPRGANCHLTASRLPLNSCQCPKQRQFPHACYYCCTALSCTAVDDQGLTGKTSDSPAAAVQDLLINDSCVQQPVHPELEVDASEKALWISCANLLLTERLYVFWGVMHFCLKLIYSAPAQASADFGQDLAALQITICCVATDVKLPLLLVSHSPDTATIDAYVQTPHSTNRFA